MKEYTTNLVSLVQESKFVFRIDKKPEFSELPEEGFLGWRWVHLHDVVKPLLEDVIKNLFESPAEWSLPNTSAVNDDVMELVNNAEKWGNKYDPEKHTWIKYSCLNHSDYCDLDFTVTDEGPGFNYAHLVDCHKNSIKDDDEFSYNNFRETPENSFGMGLFILLWERSLVWNETGNSVTMRVIIPKTPKQSIE